MKRKKIVFLVFIIFIYLFIFAAKLNYKDGIYEGSSRSIYTGEYFYGISKITIEKDKITKVDFQILDKSSNIIFDDKYEKYYEGNLLYIDQCRKNWKAMQIYPKKFLEAQDINKVDAISGATWAYNLFKSSLLEALEKAKK